MEVAKLAGVSQSAVSRVFTPGASSSEKTNKLVRKAAAKLGYRPNILARSLITGKSRIIGLVVAYLDNYFYPEALELLSSALQKKGYHVLIFMSGNKEGDIADAVDEILDYQVDGIIAASVSMSSDLAKRCKSAGVPVVLFNRTQDDKRLSAVTSDNELGGQKVASFLLAGGHKRIGYIAGWDITEPVIIEIGIDTLLKDLNFEVRPILANIPQLSDDQKRELLTNLDKNIN